MNATTSLCQAETRVDQGLFHPSVAGIDTRAAMFFPGFILSIFSVHLETVDVCDDVCVSQITATLFLKLRAQTNCI